VTPGRRGSGASMVILRKNHAVPARVEESVEEKGKK
jgi:hypothetical protein